MRLGTYPKFLFIVIHLFPSVKSNRVSSRRGFDEMSGSQDISSEPKKAKKMSDLEEYPYMVLVYIDDKSVTKDENHKACTGTMIRNDLVLTLASCLLLDYRDNPRPDIVWVIERPNNHRLHVMQILINPNYYAVDSFNWKAHDFGLLIVDPTEHTKFPRLPQSLYDFNHIKNTCILGGYGNEVGVSSSNFKTYNMSNVEIEILTSRVCDTDRNVCLHFGNLMPCKNGDYGSPLICNGVVYALNSPRYSQQKLASVNCFDVYVIPFVLVYNIKDWLEQTMEEPANKLKWMNDPLYVLVVCGIVFSFIAGIYYGLITVLQQSFDPADDMTVQSHTDHSTIDQDQDDDSWYESQWAAHETR